MDKDITGLMVYYYEVCKRKLWYFVNEIQLEENNSNVILGKLLEENTYTRDEKKMSFVRERTPHDNSPMFFFSQSTQKNRTHKPSQRH